MTDDEKLNLLIPIMRIRSLIRLKKQALDSELHQCEQESKAKIDTLLNQAYGFREALLNSISSMVDVSLVEVEAAIETSPQLRQNDIWPLVKGHQTKLEAALADYEKQAATLKICESARQGRLSMARFNVVQRIDAPFEIALVREFDRLTEERESWEDRQSSFVEAGEVDEAQSFPNEYERDKILKEIQDDFEKLDDGLRRYFYIPVPDGYDFDGEVVAYKKIIAGLIDRIESYQKAFPPAR